jgi:hypothetical protein
LQVVQAAPTVTGRAAPHVQPEARERKFYFIQVLGTVDDGENAGNIFVCEFH